MDRCLSPQPSPNSEFNNDYPAIPDEARVSAKAFKVLPVLAKRWLPDGEARGRYWVARNPRRDDKHAGSFKVDLTSGRWRDYASGDHGRDVIDLAAFVADISRTTATAKLAKMLGL